MKLARRRRCGYGDNHQHIKPEGNQNIIPFKNHRFTLCFSLDNVKNPDSPVRGARGKSLPIIVKLSIVLMRVTGQKQDNKAWHRPD